MKFWTEFTYAPTSPAHGLHCTHKFLGELSAIEVEQVQKILIRHFGTYSAKLMGEAKPVEVHFDKVEMFGEAKDVRVLVPSIPTIKLFPRLRRILDEFRKDDFDEYRPHVTCLEPITKVCEPFYSYVFKSPEAKLLEHVFVYPAHTKSWTP